MRSPNKYIVFCSFFKKILDEEYPHLTPQQKAAKAGKFWKYLPNELKNSFEIYANNDRLLKTTNTQMTRQPIIHGSLQIIYDDRVQFTPQPNEEEVIFNEMYTMYIDENASL